ncbi:UDP-glucose 6-dehydrogenase, partial [Patescibacteria group bacterium]|nr:UDP-glucose 6-dehydrogenase [Patescibacteria group bacterium]
MKILYFGAGFVGACSAAVNADSGHNVLVYDVNHELVNNLSSLNKNKIESSLFEKGLAELII